MHIRKTTLPETLMVVVSVFLFCIALYSSSRAGRFRRERDEVKAQIADLTAELAAAEGAAEEARLRARSRPAVRPPPPAASDDSGARLAAEKQAELEARIAELQGVVAARDETIAEFQSRRRRREEGRPRTGDPAERMANYMARLRETDPERYERIQERFRSFAERMETSLDQQQDFFAGLDTDAMTPEQAETHTRLMQILDRNRELIEAINEDPEADDVPELRREMFQNSREARGLLEQEREIALEEMARQLGYEDEHVGQFTNYVNYIFDVTSMRGGFRGMRGGRGGGPGR